VGGPAFLQRNNRTGGRDAVTEPHRYRVIVTHNGLVICDMPVLAVYFTCQYLDHDFRIDLQSPPGDPPGPAAAVPPAEAAAAGQQTVHRPIGDIELVVCPYCAGQVPNLEIQKVLAVTGIDCCLKCSRKKNIAEQWKKRRK